MTKCVVITSKFCKNLRGNPRKNSILLLTNQVNFTQSSKFCHTELCVAKWSIHKFKAYLKFFWIFRSFHSLKMTKVCRHCEPMKSAWQSINLKHILNSMDFSLSSESSKWQNLELLSLKVRSKWQRFEIFQTFLKFKQISKKIQKIPKKFLKIQKKFFKKFQNSLKIFPNFHKNTKAPPPACIFSDLRHFFCFILGVGLKKFANFFRKRYFLCYNFTCLWICLANEW